jgi:hypothetical protein
MMTMMSKKVVDLALFQATFLFPVRIVRALRSVNCIVCCLAGTRILFKNF